MQLPSALKQINLSRASAFAILVGAIVYLFNFMIKDGFNLHDETERRFAGVSQVICDYKKVCGGFPERDEQLRFKVCQSCLLHRICKSESDALLDLTTDLWGHPVVYRSYPNAVFIESYGADGKPGGMSDDADISREVACP